MSIRCCCCAMRSVIGAGTRRGRQREESDKPSAPVSGTQTASFGWPVPFGPSSSGERGCIGCLTRLFLLPPNLRRRPSPSLQLVVLVLAIPGAGLFSDGLLPAWRLQKRFVQKNETHPVERVLLTYPMNIQWYGPGKKLFDKVQFSL